MTSKEFQQKLRLDAAKLDVREKLEDDPVKREKIRQKKESRSALLENFNERFGHRVERATVGGD